MDSTINVEDNNDYVTVQYGINVFEPWVFKLRSILCVEKY